MARQSRYSPEVRERAVRMVHEQESSYSSRWAAVSSIAQKIGCTAETLRKWVERAEIDAGRRPGTTTSEFEELKALKRANEILRKASAFFAQAELDRKAK